MKTGKLILHSAALIALVVPAAFAQQSGSTSNTSGSTTSGTTTSGTTTTAQPTIQQRKENQQDRIANGIQDGQLTAGETKNLETKEAGVNKEEHNMRAADGGKLTTADRAKLRTQQNQLSKQISTDTHNAATQNNGTGLVGQRRTAQQARIAQGVRSGKLTAGETAKLENTQQGVNRTEAGMRQANGGKLTAADKTALNKQQNKASKQIYEKKHDDAKQ
jgi:hypothetical protein